MDTLDTFYIYICTLNRQIWLLLNGWLLLVALERWEIREDRQKEEIVN